MKKIVITKGMLIPPIRQLKESKRSEYKYPIHKMQVLDSIFVTTKSACTLPGTFAKRLPGTKWASRTLVENGVKGVRIWRIL